MGLYANHIEPRLVDFACSSKLIAALRKKITPLATGRVLEVGFGSGHNLPFLSADRIEHLWALEPSAKMRVRAKQRLAAAKFPIEFLDLPGEAIPLDNGSVDTVLITFTMCTIPDVRAALQGMRRVLKPGGRLLFCEHGRAPDARVERWQSRLNGIWGRLAGGCQLDRDIPGIIREAGFEMQHLEAAYLDRAPRFLGYNYCGIARPD